MPYITTIFAIAAGGALGALMRFITITAATRLFGAEFPYGTLLVNISGSLLMGMFASYAFNTGNMSESMRLFVMTGFLGAFTTFSAFSMDVFALFERGNNMAAFGYIMSSVVLSVIAFMLGMLAGRI